MDKKNILISGLLVAIILFGTSNILLLLSIPEPQSQDWGSTLIVGTTSVPDTLEIVDSWDEATNDILYQVVETLFSYDLYDLDLPRINLLAESYFWENLTTLHIKLREGIRFHDGTIFNAQAAKWNLDRLLYLTNCSGTNTEGIAQTQCLWMLPDGMTPIIQLVSISDEYNITITLNAPYSPLLDTLAYINAGMISPTAHAINEHRFIDTTTGKPIGTGPYKYEYYTPHKEVILSRWEGYWKNLANFKTIRFAIYEESEDLEAALLNHRIDYSTTWLPNAISAFENDSSITVKRFTDDTSLPGLVCRYFQFNTETLNETWRKALSYAINYTYYVNEGGIGMRTRSTSMISPAFRDEHNSSIIAQEFNITKARSLMVSMGFGNMSWNDNQWIEVAESWPAFKEIYCSEWSAEGILSTFKLIGVKVTSRSVSFWGGIGSVYTDDLNLIGWGPDYFDAFNMLYDSLNTRLWYTISCGIGAWNIYEIPPLNDTWVNLKLDLALQTIDDEARNNIYKDIQWYLSDVLHSHTFVYHPNIFFVHSADLYNIPYNAIERFQAYGIRRG